MLDEDKLRQAVGKVEHELCHKAAMTQNGAGDLTESPRMGIPAPLHSKPRHGHMPPIAILSDIHSNLIALQAVLREVKDSGATRIVFLGDIVGYGSHPAECVEWVRRLGGECVMGNHDVALKTYRRPGFLPAQPNWRDDDFAAGLMHSAKALDEGQAAWMAQLPYWMQIPGGVAAHASLDDLSLFNYIEDAGSAAPTLALLEKCPEPVGFFGHTHLQEVYPNAAEGVEWMGEQRFRIKKGMPCVVMVGSVGQNRHESDRRACWALWHPDTRIVEFRQVEYDRKEAARKILEAGLPKNGALRLLAKGEEESLFV
jgi:diadenosine tetraphosphatase ApaH/serine/threonine PP2A family protein phosphatase